MPCTTILVGKNASYDGSTIVARNEDSGEGHFTPKKFITVNPSDQPREYCSVISKVKISLPDEPMRYTAMPNALNDEGIWGEAGFNEANVGMSETETITSNPRVLGADPMVKGGIGEEDFLTIVLPYIHSAREGVLRLGSLLEQFGTYEMNGIAFQDADDIWWMETIGGHHWMAKRVPDDSYAVGPNQLGIDSFDLSDALSDRKNHMCSEDLADFIESNHLDVSFHGEPLRQVKELDARAIFGSHADSDHSYNTPRAWFMERYLNPSSFRWDGPGADFRPESDDIPWCLVPEKKISVEDVKYVLSSYYQGTPFNPYGNRSDPHRRGMYRPIGVNRTNFVAISQIRPYVPKEIACVEWIAVSSNAFNAAVPFYANVKDTPAYLRDTDDTVTTDSFYWINRLIGALADAHYDRSMIFIERYQNRMASLGHQYLREADNAYLNDKPQNVTEFLEKKNQDMADTAKKETSSLLGQILQVSSEEMKNEFGRSDA